MRMRCSISLQFILEATDSTFRAEGENINKEIANGTRDIQRWKN